ncbi:hypothetical protein L3V79_05570 [Thiotrichales bacterium 19S9-12]|nr:hypothetical protein [Thiotrichales bacterium 19S9-11]MCF6811828.1 hypothetical protein [Thiotrichales bacterium 19S9-12]
MQIILENQISTLMRSPVDQQKNNVQLIVNEVLTSDLTDIEKEQKLMAVGDDGNTGLYIALTRGFGGIVSGYVDAVLSSNLENKVKKRLLLANDQNGTPGFLLALLGTENNAVNEYVNLITHSDLPEFDVDQLLLINIQFISLNYLLNRALIHNHYAVVELYTKTILNASISSQEKLRLLLAKDQFSTPGLYLAMSNNAYEAVDIYLKLIKNSELALEDKINLFLASHPNGDRGIEIAIRNKHHQMLNSYFSSIEDIELVELKHYKSLYKIYRYISNELKIGRLLSTQWKDAQVIRYKEKTLLVSAEVAHIWNLLTDHSGYFQITNPQKTLDQVKDQISINNRLGNIEPLGLHTHQQRGFYFSIKQQCGLVSNLNRP